MATLMLSPAWRREHPEADREVAAWLWITSAAALALELEGLASARDLVPELSAFRGELVLRVGDADVGAPVAWSRELAAAVEGTSLTVVPAWVTRCGSRTARGRATT